MLPPSRRVCERDVRNGDRGAAIHRQHQYELFQSQADLQQTLTRLGITQTQQNQIVADIAADTSMSITSDVTIPNNIAGNFGIEFHDGEMPNEIDFV
ncbi:MAG TPA: hypothetical protein VHW46_16815 [Terracidiphilus sp.]|nr:hypothetical protein [Terracidiphilus sp.]